jgi:hypothetical protein
MLILSKEKSRLVPSASGSRVLFDGLAEIMEPRGEASLIRPCTETVADVLNPFCQELRWDGKRCAEGCNSRCEVAQ